MFQKTYHGNMAPGKMILITPERVINTPYFADTFEQAKAWVIDLLKSDDIYTTCQPRNRRLFGVHDSDTVVIWQE